MDLTNDPGASFRHPPPPSTVYDVVQADNPEQKVMNSSKNGEASFKHPLPPSMVYDVVPSNILKQKAIPLNNSRQHLPPTMNTQNSLASSGLGTLGSSDTLATIQSERGLEQENPKSQRRPSQ